MTSEVFNTDCLEYMRTLPDKAFQLAIADPPYGVSYARGKTGDSTVLFDYVTKRLLPHMVYYCAHCLRMGKDHSLSASRQAVGLILTRIFGGRPITNITYTCKHMLRIHRNRGDFWYYEQAPADVKMMVNRIDFAPLAEVWKISKDRRI